MHKKIFQYFLKHHELSINVWQKVHIAGCRIIQVWFAMFSISKVLKWRMKIL